MGYIRKTPEVLGALDPGSRPDKSTDRPMGADGPKRSPRGTKAIVPSQAHTLDQKE